jgi:phage terminase small subunit
VPRKSAASLHILPSPKPSTRIRQPSDLGEAELAVWLQLTRTTDAAHFLESDLPLLVEYCRAVVLAQQAGRELAQNGAVVNGRASAWLVIQEKQIRAMTALSHRLRLSPQSRQDKGRKTGGLKASIYDE